MNQVRESIRHMFEAEDHHNSDWFNQFNYYFTVQGPMNSTFFGDFCRHCIKDWGIYPVYYSARIHNGKPYYNNYGYLFLMKNKEDIEQVLNYDLSNLAMRADYISDVHDFNPDEYIFSSGMKKDTDVYVIRRYPIGKYNKSELVKILDASNEYEAQKEYYDYFSDHRGDNYVYYYDKMSRGQAERIMRNKKKNETA